MPSHLSYWVPIGAWSLLLPSNGYNPVVHKYTYLDWVYQVPITHLSNGAGSGVNQQIQYQQESDENPTAWYSPMTHINLMWFKRDANSVLEHAK